MVGPSDLRDWSFDERDVLSAWLRRHDCMHAVVCGQDAGASAFPMPLRALACRFAAQEELAMDELWQLAEALSAMISRAA